MKEASKTVLVENRNRRVQTIFLSARRKRAPSERMIMIKKKRGLKSMS